MVHIGRLVTTAEEELARLIEILPEPLSAVLRTLPGEELLEVLLDLGRLPEARLTGGVVTLDERPIEHEDLRHVLDRIGPLGEDNRAGIERTLHRIAAIRNRRGDVVGLTLRIGRAVIGTIDMLRDLVESGLNLLLLGRPGIGKTTKLREMARVLADDFGKRVVIVDTSNEIGGDGDIPHPGIGRARRMQVPKPDRQHAVMIEAVENHMPEVILIDEIGTLAEAQAARTIAERGVQLIGTAHGNTLENLVLNPTLSDLVGGVHTVTLGDEEARRRRSSKTVTERRGPPTFDIVVELMDRAEVLVHRDTAEAVDHLLAGRGVGGERRREVEGRVTTEAVVRAKARLPTPPPEPMPAKGPVRILAYALSRELLERVLSDLDVEARLVRNPGDADLVLALRARADDPLPRDLAERGVPVHVLKHNTTADMRRALRNALSLVGGVDEAAVREAVHEAEHAIARVMSEGVPVALAPRPPALRKVQHRIAARYHLETISTGSEPLRHLIVHPSPRALDEHGLPEEG
ncbi:MAG TPA: R3H domain-containing nucleic acid-binding protein [Polyangia bacterium]|nr:R3H domain-containing nucleic acid-binding protein [Polyangia bacterium]